MRTEKNGNLHNEINSYTKQGNKENISKVFQIKKTLMYARQK